MRGPTHSQVEALFHYVKGIGMSRHLVKLGFCEDVWIHSDNSRHTYVRVWHRVADHAQTKFGIDQILEISTEMMVDWLELQRERPIAPATLRTYLSAVSKFQKALDYYKRGGGDAHVPK